MAEQTQKPEQKVNVNVESTPVLYSDMIIWNMNKEGVVLNFGQRIMGSDQVTIVSRIGMSRELAKKLNDFMKDLALTEAEGQIGKKS